MEKTGLKKGFVDKSHIDSGLTDQNMSKILDAYPNISAVWLITGRGPMLTPVHADTGAGENVLAQMPAPAPAKEAHTAPKPPKLGNYASDRLNDEKNRLYESLLAQYKAEISDANRHIGRLEERIEELQAKLDSSASHADSVPAAFAPAAEKKTS